MSRDFLTRYGSRISTTNKDGSYSKPITSAAGIHIPVNKPIFDPPGAKRQALRTPLLGATVTAELPSNQHMPPTLFASNVLNCGVPPDIADLRNLVRENRTQGLPLRNVAGGPTSNSDPPYGAAVDIAQIDHEQTRASGGAGCGLHNEPHPFYPGVQPVVEVRPQWIRDMQSHAPQQSIHQSAAPPPLPYRVPFDAHLPASGGHRDCNILPARPTGECQAQQRRAAEGYSRSPGSDSSRRVKNGGRGAGAAVARRHQHVTAAQHSPRSTDRRLQGGTRCGTHPRAKLRHMAYLKSVGMDHVTPKFAHNRDPEEFYRHDQRIRDNDPQILNEKLVKTARDQLYFSKRSRSVNFRPYTLKDYRVSRPQEYVELGKLPADLNTDELIAKRANKERIREFSRNLRAINASKIKRHAYSSKAVHRTGDTIRHEEKVRKQRNSARQKAMEFARNIPRPRQKLVTNERNKCLGGRNVTSEGSMLPDMTVQNIDHPMSALDELERQHDLAVSRIARIRSEVGSL